MKTKDPNLTKTPKQTTSNSISETSLESETIKNKGTVTLEKDQFESKHVDDLDNPARQPDRRDQQGGSSFSMNTNEADVQDGAVENLESNAIDRVNTSAKNANQVDKTEVPQSDEITDANKYATVDNAQTRVLNEDLKD